MFRIALVLFKTILGQREQLEECPTLYETMEKLRHIPPEYMTEEFIAREVSSGTHISPLALASKKGSWANEIHYLCWQ